MELYKRQQFEFLLQTAVERLVERLQLRMRGYDAALQALSDGHCQTEVSEFVNAIFRDFLLDNIDGACFVLASVPQRRIGQDTTFSADTTTEVAMLHLAMHQFEKLLFSKTMEALQQHSGYQPYATGAAT